MQLIIEGVLKGNIPAILAIFTLLFALFLGRSILPLKRVSGWRMTLFLLLFIFSFFIRGVFVPVAGRHIYDGHEADYFDVMRGAKEVPSENLFMYYPAVTWLYRVIGIISGGGGKRSSPSSTSSWDPSP